MTKKGIYTQPLRVYIVLAALAFYGIYSGLNLPVSLFPTSSKPEVYISLSYGGVTAEEFLTTFGRSFEFDLNHIDTEDAKVERVDAEYGGTGVQYNVLFKWGSDPTAAEKEAQNVINAWSSRFSTQTRDSYGIWLQNENSGFFVASYYSEQRSLDELYSILDSVLTPRLPAVTEADAPSLWNNSRQEIRIEARVEAMANLGLVPRDVDAAVTKSLATKTGGTLQAGSKRLRVIMPRNTRAIEDIRSIPIRTPSSKVVLLGEIASVELVPNTMDTNIIKTSGAPAIVLFSRPKPGGNVKKMSEELVSVMNDVQKQLPKDIKYRVLVDPSHFIQSSIDNVFKEVLIGSLLAVSVLFVFIGSFKNVATAAIEIPLSIVLAFILMKFFNVNVNLISLGGLALSAGMNVDASVVVMENIFRRFEESRAHKFAVAERIRLVYEAVAEVRLPIIVSTIASLVVFIPLTFTSDLSYAILGDLAKAVVFSHGFSAIVALVLVPTVRLQLMAGERGNLVPTSPFESALKKLENSYASLLTRFVRRPAMIWLTIGAVTATLIALIVIVLPGLPREVIGKPDSDMIFLSIRAKDNTNTLQMDEQVSKIERDLLQKLGDKISYTFTQIYSPNGASILSRLSSQRDMNDVWKKIEKEFKNTPELSFNSDPWNPSELPIPDPPNFRIAVRGGDLATRRDIALELQDEFQKADLLPRIWTKPYAIERTYGVVLQPQPEQWHAIANAGYTLLPQDLTDISIAATSGYSIDTIPIKGKSTPIVLKYGTQELNSTEDLMSLPVGVGSKIVPFRALMPGITTMVDPPIYRENLEDVFLVVGKRNNSDPRVNEAKMSKAVEKAVDSWRAKTQALQPKDPGTDSHAMQPLVTIEDPGKDVSQAIHQLGFAIAMSVALIIIVLLVQFGSFAESLLVVVAIPLGFIGVLLALFVFRSTLSLNSALGVILLNGISVNNSIILVDFARRLHESGASPLQAILQTAQKRLRPILITSLTTVLGMMPIALGFGEGGKVLQPLGIAVSGGLWISMTLTLFLVPALHYVYLSRRSRNASTEANVVASDAILGVQNHV
ncbi:MAG: efflux RND transporter permease subunit [Oligoflexales bacterium]